MRLLLALLLLLWGCSTTRLSHEKLASELPAQPFERLLVLGPPGLAERQAFEEAFSRQFNELSGTSAFAGSIGLSPEVPPSAEAMCPYDELAQPEKKVLFY